MIDLAETIFPLLAELITKRLPTFQELKLEIETELVQMLVHITTTSAYHDPLTVAARRRVVQQGFMEYYLGRSAAAGYTVVDEGSLD